MISYLKSRINTHRRLGAAGLTAALLIMSVITGAEAKEPVQVRGSDTMINLMQRMAELYQEKNPGNFICVNGGGSGTGIAGLRNRTVDIANSSREIKEREKIDLRSKGVEPSRIVVALDCITIVVNKANKVDKLTFDQVGAIFRGETTNWKELGGADMQITLYGRQSNSGTFELLREQVLKGDYADSMRRMNGNGQIIEALNCDVSGIGYVGVGFAKNAPELNVVSIAKEAGAEYINPVLLSASETGRYSMAREMYQYTNGKPSGEVRNFIMFCVGPEGQKVCEEMGFFPISAELQEMNRKVLNI